MAYYRCGGGVPSSVKSLPTYKTASGSVATFETDMTENLISCIADIVATQSGSGTPSPSNPRPIQTYTSLNLSHSGSDTSNPTVYNIPFGQTVANGVLDVTTGKLTVTHIRLSTQNWIKSLSNYSTFYCTPSEVPKFISNTQFDYKCSHYNSVSLDNATTAGDNYIYTNQLKRVAVKDTSLSNLTPAEFAQYMEDVQFIYLLETPLTVQLSATQITALLNENNIWCDTGNTSVKYILSVGEALRQG